MLTAAQVEQAVNEERVRIDEDFVGGGEFWSELKYGSGDYVLVIDDVEYPAVYVESYGGMDKGSDIWVVFKLGEQLFKKSGFYASHYGTDWDGPLIEVKPVEKVITVFEKAN